MSKRGNPNCTVDEQYTFLDEIEILNFFLSMFQPIVLKIRLGIQVE